MVLCINAGQLPKNCIYYPINECVLQAGMQVCHPFPIFAGMVNRLCSEIGETGKRYVNLSEVRHISFKIRMTLAIYFIDRYFKVHFYKKIHKNLVISKICTKVPTETGQKLGGNFVQIFASTKPNMFAFSDKKWTLVLYLLTYKPVQWISKRLNVFPTFIVR